ncbi:YaeQ family protein [Chitinivorax sp. B]|uniref:YaeQ family protein n=1 Tax=Chitinivorax sp. B TaxID=2502235 RepID=UPI0010F96C97|nr:YaeQ family protein [Chitinivorax sp. B]
MALKATIFKAQLQIADMDRHYYQDHNVTLARHPSENDERMMVRLLAYALYAHERLDFGKGLCDDETPDICLMELTGDMALWIELGQPDEKRLRKACSRAEKTVVFAYSGNSADIWWEQIKNKVNRLESLTVYNLPYVTAVELAKLAQRTMQLQCTIQEGQVWLTDGVETVQVDVAAAKVC